MKKRDFIQTATVQFMPNLDWDLDKSIQYAEKLWLKLTANGYGDSQPSQPRDMVNYYQQLSVTGKKQFDQFWTAFNYKAGKQRAAMRWAQIGDLSPSDLKKIIIAAKQIDSYRKQNPGQTPVMAERWLCESRFDDFEKTDSEKNGKQQNKEVVKIRELTGNLNHAKLMAENCEDEFWPAEVEKLTEKLKVLRGKL